ncbi:23S rRNA (uracil(1939)-C(5))-methyltransferase RlmD [Pseudodesulfovibrio tunisiensis]|uniref:23S rRNA (uracil(1939)-C(5))-methyltransferase RlmD n=1 Tax=Pseudodesulfovibrio tunisiensis TaxID=463192 RepID=UPI001FB1C0C5|nr:23S rRNA (uracil(1939)-C(5))-methyltransferase RlmD [Pseudodesulfovibrio tunisiensis]
MLEKGNIVECEVESLAFGGRGVARVHGMAVFIEGALPGDTVEAEIVRAKKRFAEGVTRSVLKPSPHRTEPRCPHFGECGGCSLQHLDYAQQLAQKSDQVRDALVRIGGADPSVMLAPAGSPEIWNYRNKMEFAFQGTGKSLRVGLRRAVRSGDPERADVLDIRECFLCSPDAMKLLRAVRRFCRESRVPAFDPRTGKGYWRHLVVRHTATGECMVHLITAADPRLHARAEELGGKLRKDFPGLTSFVHSSRKSRRTLAFGERVQNVQGRDSIEERLGQTRYRISANAFFQTNTAGAEILFDTVREMAGLKGDESLLDLYCGTGGIGLFLSQGVRKVTGYELSPESVEDARANAALNHSENCEFHAGSLESGLPGLADMARPDVIVTDPPRSGMHQEIAEAVLKLAPPRIVAVACDPATLARDVKRLAPAYELRAARAVDMFPHTTHIEAVALLERTSK